MKTATATPQPVAAEVPLGPEEVEWAVERCCISGEELGMARERILRCKAKHYALERFESEASKLVPNHFLKPGIRASIPDPKEPAPHFFGRFNKVRQALDQAETSLAAEQMSAPKIVLAGAMNSGKSSFVNRLCGVNLSPSGNSDDADVQGVLTTPCSVTLKLRHGEPEVPTLRIYAKEKLVHESKFAVCQALQVVGERTRAAILATKAAEPGTVSSSVYSDKVRVEISLRARCYPDLDVVDLPGLRQNPKDDSEICQSILERHLRELHDACWVVLLPAYEKSWQAAVLRQLPETLEHRINIVTRPDDVSVRELSKGTYWSDLSQLGRLICFNDPDAASWGAKLASEQKFFEQLNTEQRACFDAVGVPEIVRRLEQWYMSIVAESWIPDKLIHLERIAKDLETQDVELGRPLPGSEAVRYMKEMSAQALCLVGPSRVLGETLARLLLSSAPPSVLVNGCKDAADLFEQEIAKVLREIEKLPAQICAATLERLCGENIGQPGVAEQTAQIMRGREENVDLGVFPWEPLVLGSEPTMPTAARSDQNPAAKIRARFGAATASWLAELHVFWASSIQQQMAPLARRCSFIHEPRVQRVNGTLTAVAVLKSEQVLHEVLKTLGGSFSEKVLVEALHEGIGDRFLAETCFEERSKLRQRRQNLLSCTESLLDVVRSYDTSSKPAGGSEHLRKMEAGVLELRNVLTSSTATTGEERLRDDEARAKRRKIA